MTVPGRVAAGWSRPVALTVAAAFFLEQVDGTILATALPAVARDFGVRPSTVGVALTAYLVTVAALIPVSGWLSDRYGGRRVFLIAVAGFVAASVLCGLSSRWRCWWPGGCPGCGRCDDGAGRPFHRPVGHRQDRSRPRRRVSDLAGAAAPVIAPFLGGVITQYAGWPWIFFVNVPLGAVLLAVAWRVIPAAAPAGRAGLDVATLVLLVAGVVGLVVGLQLVADPARVWVAAALLGSRPSGSDGRCGGPAGTRPRCWTCAPSPGRRSGRPAPAASPTASR